MNIIKCFVVILFSFISAWAICQSQMVYSCDFEDGENLNDWLFVTDSTSSNAWVIGNADASSGSNSLYLSTNSGTTASYDKAHASVVMACLTLPLEAAKEYSLVFDAFACGGSSADKLSICIISDSTISVTAVGGTQLPAWYSNCVVDSLSNSTYITNKSISLQGTGANVRVVFVWENGVDLSSTGSGAMIDNVVVYETITSGCTLDFDSPAEQAEWRRFNNA